MGENQKVNNYEKWCEEWRRKFLAMDKETLKRRLPELQDEGEAFSICHFGKKYGIRKDTGEIFSMDEEESLSHQVRLNLYTLFGYVKGGAPALPGSGCRFPGWNTRGLLSRPLREGS